MSMSEEELKAEVDKLIVRVGNEVRTNHDALGKLFLRFADEQGIAQQACNTWNRVISQVLIERSQQSPKEGGFRTS